MHQGEQQKAAERIGETSEKALRWLLRYSKMDLTKLSEGQWLDLEKEMDVFLLTPPPGLKTSWDFKQKPLRGGFRWEQPSLHPTPGFRSKLFWRRRVMSFQPTVRRWLQQLMQPGGIWFGPMELQLILRHPRFFLPKVSDAELPENFGFHATFANYEQALAYNFAHLIGAHSGRLRLCAACKELFLADRRQQVFCSAVCLNRITQRRWRAKQKGANRPKSKVRREKLRGGSSNGKKRR
jgi:hypothetical protein